MKKKLIYAFSLLSALGIIVTIGTQQTVHSNSTGAPSSASCTGCHGGSILTSNDVFIEVWDSADNKITSYEAGKQYIIDVGTERELTKAGFALSANEGTFSKFTPEDQSTQIVSGFATHTASGTTSINEWSVRWTAPNTSSSPVQFVFYLNEANGDGSTSGDKIYRTILSLPPANSTGLNTVFTQGAVHAYPNPATAQLTIQYELRQPSDVQINLMSMDGKIIQNLLPNTIQSGSQVITIPTVHIQPGVYILSINTHQHRVVKKIFFQ
jgi:hypothetical protein